MATRAEHGTLAFTVSELGYIAKALSACAVRHVRFNRIGIYREWHKLSSTRSFCR